MTCCLLTVIKNEHEYLEEWIKYHLNLGIEHIFIFEDFDSLSHKNITDKFVKNITLNNINVLFDEESDKIILDLKLTKKSNPQFIYFKKGLSYIKRYYKYDWCFVIDNDEFITLENNNKNLKETMLLYLNYDAFVLQWKIFGANGYIHKPDYNNKGLIDTYVKLSRYLGHNKLEWTTKVCYNLNTFHEQYLKNCHSPSDVCKWCKTNFDNSKNNISYNNIYIRHYMTKSWEEYIDKRKRGYFMGFARTIDLFFLINPDMLPNKQELINELKKEILIILPYKLSGSQGKEINIALSCWKKFCTFKYHFIVIGEFNDLLQKAFPWVEFIYCPTIKNKVGQYNPHLDFQNKFNIICKMYSLIYDGFIWMVDDNYAIKDFSISDILKIHYHNNTFTGNKNAPVNYWKYDKYKTKLLLTKESLPTINYTTHFPCYFEFKKLKEIWKKFDMFNESYVLEDIYFNYFKHDEPILDSEIRLGIWNQDIFKNEFQQAINNPNIKFICNSVEGWSKELENALEEIYK